MKLIDILNSMKHAAMVGTAAAGLALAVSACGKDNGGTDASIPADAGIACSYDDGSCYDAGQDSDCDGVPDEVEKAMGTDAYNSQSFPLNCKAKDGDDDDCDTFSNEKEKKCDSDYKNPKKRPKKWCELDGGVGLDAGEPDAQEFDSGYVPDAGMDTGESPDADYDSGFVPDAQELDAGEDAGWDSGIGADSGYDVPVYDGGYDAGGDVGVDGGGLVPPICIYEGPKELNLKVGEEFTLDWSKSYDPDCEARGSCKQWFNDKGIIKYCFEYGISGRSGCGVEPGLTNSYPKPGNYNTKSYVVDSDNLESGKIDILINIK